MLGHLISAVTYDYNVKYRTVLLALPGIGV
jgi:hypothetical protein